MTLPQKWVCRTTRDFESVGEYETDPKGRMSCAEQLVMVQLRNSMLQPGPATLPGVTAARRSATPHLT